LCHFTPFIFAKVGFLTSFNGYIIFFGIENREKRIERREKRIEKREMRGESYGFW